MEVITWNINKAAYVRTNLWEYIKQINFDVGLFQEVYIIPSELRKNFFVMHGEMSAILVKKKNGIILKQSDFGLECKNSPISDFFTACKVETNEKQIEFISIYNYMGTSEQDFKQFLLILYQYIENKNNVIIGGDLNMNINFQGSLSNWGEIAQNMIAKLEKLNYTNAQPSNKKDIFTYLTPSKKAKYQLDYLFIPNNFSITDVKIDDINNIFFTKPRLSDHLPLSAEINF